MATNGKRWSAAQAVCPRPEHAGSRVRFDGKYGKPGHRRQLYRCTPRNGDRPHRFTELLPREEAWHDACECASERSTCTRGRAPRATTSSWHGGSGGASGGGRRSFGP